MRSERFELSRDTPLPPEDSASASSATTAYEIVAPLLVKNMVRLVRLELTRSKDHYPLKVARLPFRHSRIWCLSTESNRGHKDFQSFALPTELPRHIKLATRIRFELTISAVTGRHVRPLHHRANFKWWSMTGSNCRHPACKAGALPAELIDHIGDLWGIRTPEPAVKGRCLNHLTNRP